MPRNAQGTPPGTGLVGCLTPDQKKCLNAVWAALLVAMSTEISETPALKTTAKARSRRSRSLVSRPASDSEKAAVPQQKIKARAPFAPEEGGLRGQALREMIHANILGDNPDSLVLRFLRAKDWDAADTVRILKRSLRWRRDYNVAELAAENENTLDKKYAGYRRQLELGKLYMHGTDKMGRLIIYMTARLHKAHAQPRETMEKFVVQTLEIGRLLIHPNEEACIIFDMSHFGFIGQADLKILKFAMNLLQYHYPECCGLFIILDVPRATQTLWKVISPWLAESFASKVRFASHTQDLLKYIDAEHLPASFEGGRSQWKYEYMAPVRKQDSRRKDSATREDMIQRWKTLLWKYEALVKERIDCEEVETLHARAEAVIEAEMEGLAKDLRVAYFRMRPYVCTRNLYERSDNPPLREDGSVVWSY
ncbi:unnamed protein product [Mortierella alpina]